MKPLEPKKILFASAKWLINTIAENIVGTILVSSTLIIFLASYFASVSNWLHDMLNTPPMQWSTISTAVILSIFILLLATLLYVLRFLFIKIRFRFAWIDYGGFKWMAVRHSKEIKWMPFCLTCQIELVQPEYSDAVFCPSCKNHWPMSYEKHKLLYDSATSIASQKYQWHL
jgi:hypothetical protein